MTKEQQREAIKRMIDAYTNEAATTKKKAKATLVREGIYTKKGNLTKHYGGRKSAA